MKELRDKIAKENSFDDWDDLCFHYGELSSINRFDKLTKFVDEVVQRYAKQYKDDLEVLRKGFEAIQEALLKSGEKNKELVEMLEEAKRVLSGVQSPATPAIFCVRDISELLNKQSSIK